MRKFAVAEWQRAHRTLATAGQLVEPDPDSAASRAYYAAFHALTALFAMRGQTYSKHSALRAALHRELIQNGPWGPELGRGYDFLMDLREMGDYGGLAYVTPENARAAVENARLLLDTVRKLCPELDAPDLQP